MQSLGDLRVQIRGFARDDGNGQSSARRMSLSRVLVVRSYLMDKGVKPVRLDVQALGTETDKTPLDRVDLVFVR
jgi:outer membrane protein OmpA-like peptidoglycan-associated protein